MFYPLFELDSGVKSVVKQPQVLIWFKFSAFSKFGKFIHRGKCCTRRVITLAVAAGIGNWSCCWNHLGIFWSRPWRRSNCARFASFCDRMVGAPPASGSPTERKWRRSSIFRFAPALKAHRGFWRGWKPLFSLLSARVKGAAGPFLFVWASKVAVARQLTRFRHSLEVLISARRRIVLERKKGIRVRNQVLGALSALFNGRERAAAAGPIEILAAQHTQHKR